MLSEDINFLTTSKTNPLYGIAFPVVEGMGGFFTKTEGVTTVMSSLKQLLLTSKGERVMNPEFGTNLRKAVFEIYDIQLKPQLSTEIIQAIRIHLPVVDIQSLEISFDESLKTMGRNQVYVSLKFKISGDVTGLQILEIVV